MLTLNASDSTHSPLPMSSTTINVAVLDDYNSHAPSYTSDLAPNLHITIYKDTVLPSPNPQALIDRLKPYDVVCTMRERTPFPRAVLEGLPRLKYLLTTGGGNRAIDLGCCRERGVVVAGTAGKKAP